MATYQDLFDLRRNQGLIDKVTTAVVIAAETIFTETSGANLANRQTWAREAIINPRKMAEVFMGVVLAANKSATRTSILAAADSAIQTNVDDAVDDFANGTAVL